ncbi:TetR family transcriptional regulator [Kribbella sp. VKM Ac-2527]|uniref:TetR family transcriptional regulator n=1 Tax=Kribbella caucasensis TaxID=2512215 RepID=A0A4V3C5K0_9ACTN|nr:TetR/AcrR family transcriptional regulator [Kribbella sp. VKM Ac-2527]TDO30178.1 TetR family transcriptional regulator [Kribbella sp. VKM Ac-2527]
MTSTTRRRDAVENRERILQVGRQVLAASPDASLADIAQAAGVVRRTVYAHFPTREALLQTVAEEAAASVRDVLASLDTGDKPAETLARFVVNAWPVVDRYRLLVDLTTQNVAPDGVRDALAGIRADVVRLMRRGQEEGDFTAEVTAEVLAYTQQSLMLGLLAAVTDGVLDESEAAHTAAMLALQAVGVPTARRRKVLGDVRR